MVLLLGVVSGSTESLWVVEEEKEGALVIVTTEGRSVSTWSGVEGAAGKVAGVSSVSVVETVVVVVVLDDSSTVV